MPEPTNESSQAPVQLSHDEYLAQQHEEYLKRVDASGMPLWLLEAYYNQGY